MNLVDTHAHIYSSEFDSDKNGVVERAKKAGIRQILLPAIDASTHATMLNLENDYPGFCVSMMGLHPCSVKENYQQELQLVEDYLSKRKFIAVGEIGLDFYWDVSFKEQQYTAFHQQIEWAIQYDIPIAIHSRNATDECIEVVKQYRNRQLRGVFHCFSGTPEQAAQLTDLGFYLGIGGVVTFKNGGLDKVVKEVGLEYLILETDAPYLAPVPFRGKRNESSYIPYIAQKLADSKEMSIEAIADATTLNAEKLFGI